MRNQMTKNNKRKREFGIGECVKISIPKIDRNSTDRIFVFCKIINVLGNDMFQLSCQFGIIEMCYSSAELEPLENQDVPELSGTLPTKRISLREAARKQSAFNEDNNNNDNCICNCNKGCKSKVCPCKKKNSNCTSRCHSGRSCFNRIV
jgi:hypothetical protein